MTINILKIQLLLLLTLCTVTLSAQNEGVVPLALDATKYLNQSPTKWSGADYSTPRTLFERLYMVGGASAFQTWQYDGELNGDRHGFTSRLAMGVNLAPVHSLEVGASWSDMERVNGSNFTSMDISYLFNLSAYAARSEESQPFEIFAKAGTEVWFENSASLHLTGAFRFQYNLSPSFGFYMEPGVAFCGVAGSNSHFSRGDVSSSIMVGATVNLSSVTNYVKGVVEARRDYWAATNYTVEDIIAVKSNLLYDIVTLLNFGVESPITPRLSVAAEMVVPWWQSKSNGTGINVFSGTLECRYWFGDRSNRDQLTGFFAGVYTGGGYYDLRATGEGYQGEFFVALGLSGGYAHAINRRGNLRMEYAVGIGYLSTNYKNYTLVQNNDILWWQYDGSYDWFGPTKVGASLVWLITGKKVVR